MIRHRLSLSTRVLYTDGSAQLGGGSRVLLSILKHLDRSIEPHVLLSEHGPMEDELRALGIPYGILDLRPSPMGKQALQIARLAFELVRRHIDLIHANDPLTYRLASLAARALSIPAICHIHHPVNGLRWALKIAPHRVLTPTQFMREKIAAQSGYPVDRIEVVGNPIDTAWFSPGPHSLGEGPHISIAGLIAPHKGHDCFLRMAAEILRSTPEAKFHIVGPCQNPLWRAQLKDLATELGISHALRWWGWVNDIVARDILRGSSLFVLPSKEEGFCLAVAEAQACGVPVLTSAIRPLDEVVMSGGGYLLPPDDYRAFASKAIEILKHPKPSVRDAIHRRFGVQGFMGKIFCTYKTILTGKSGDSHEISTAASTAATDG